MRLIWFSLVLWQIASQSTEKRQAWILLLPFDLRRNWNRELIKHRNETEKTCGKSNLVDGYKTVSTLPFRCIRGFQDRFMVKIYRQTGLPQNHEVSLTKYEGLGKLFSVANFEMKSLKKVSDVCVGRPHTFANAKITKFPLQFGT